MSDEWPDDDARFTGPNCRLDVGGAASGEFTKRPEPKPAKVPTGAIKKYALCQLVPGVLEHAPLLGIVRSSTCSVVVVDEFDDEGDAEFAARHLAIKERGGPCTVTVLPVWRVNDAKRT